MRLGKKSSKSKNVSYQVFKNLDMMRFYYGKIDWSFSSNWVFAQFLQTYSKERLTWFEEIFQEYKPSFKNKVFKTLEAVIDKLQEGLRGLEGSVVSPSSTRMLFESEWVLKASRWCTNVWMIILKLNDCIRKIVL